MNTMNSQDFNAPYLTSDNPPRPLIPGHVLKRYVVPIVVALLGLAVLATVALLFV